MTITTTSEIVSAIKFIVAEIGRLGVVLRSGRISEENGFDMIAAIPNPARPGMEYICGRAALQKIDEISECALRRSKLVGRVLVTDIRSVTSGHVGRLISDASITTEVAAFDKMMAAIQKAAKTLTGTFNILLPCHLMTASEPNFFDVGPVRFMSRKHFQKWIVEQKENHDDGRWQKGQDYSRGLLAESLRHYRRFNWIARIEVVNASEAAASAIAKRISQSALDCLHLVFGSHHSKHMRIAVDVPSRGADASLIIGPTGNIAISATSGGQGHVGFEQDWWDKVTSDEVLSEMLMAYGQLIAISVNPDFKVRPAKRFLDAARWFGEAIRDEYPPSRVVKLLTAMERLLIAKEPRAPATITSTLSQRMAAICVFSFKGSIFEQELKTAERAYDLRSDLVHGSIAPDSDKVLKGLKECQDICERVMRGTLLTFSRLKVFEENPTDGKFEASFTSFAEKMKNLQTLENSSPMSPQS